MPAPLGIKSVKLALPTLTNSPTFTELLNQTLGATPGLSAGILSNVAAMSAIQAALDLDLPNMISDLGGIDDLLSALDVLQWGSPEPDFGPITAYVTQQRDLITKPIAPAQPIATVPIVGPDGNPIAQVGAPPGQGGSPPPGSPPYVLHHLIPFNFNPAILVGPATLTGPNPPFVSLAGFAQDNPAAGGHGWAALININPAHGGSFSAQLQYKLGIVLTGILTVVTYNVSVLVVIV